MKKHTELTISRIKNFLKYLKNSYYSQHSPMLVSYYRSNNYVPFEKAIQQKFVPISIGTQWGKKDKYAWFKFSGVIPETFKNCEVVALINVGGEACLINKKGMPLQGLTNKKGGWAFNGDILKHRIHISKNAKGGEKVELLLDASAHNIMVLDKNIITGEYENDGILNQADMAIFDRQKWNLFLDYEFLFSLANILNNNSRQRKQILAALNEVINNYGKGSSTDVKRCSEILKIELQKKANASSLNSIAIGHGHLDIAWLWTTNEAIRKAARTFSSALTLIDEYPDFIFGFTQPWIYNKIKLHYPLLYEKIKEAIKNKQWECIGAMWVEADCNIPSGESLIRQLIYGTTFFKNEFNATIDTLALPDGFGFPASLPQLLKKSEIKYFLTQKLSWNQFNQFPHNTFWWKGIDGSQIFTHFLTQGEYSSDCLPEKLVKLETHNNDAERTNYALFFYGIGDGGGGVKAEHIERLKKAKNLESLPKMKMGFVSDFFKKCLTTSHDLQTWQGELYLELHRGTLTTQALIKKYNRKLEILLLQIEFLYTLFDIKNYPSQKLEEVWKILLTNQFHDIITGTSISEVYSQTINEYKKCQTILSTLLNNILNKIAIKTETNKLTKTYLIVNTTSFNQNSIIEIPEQIDSASDVHGNILKVQKNKNNTLININVPAMGYTTFEINTTPNKKRTSNSLIAQKYKLENTLLKIIFNNDGSIKSIFDKEANRQIIEQGKKANALCLYDDNTPIWDAWDIEMYYREILPSYPTLKTIYVLEHGPLRASLYMEYTSSNYSLNQIVSIYENSKRIDFNTTVVWNETNKLLRAEFPINIKWHEASYDIQYGNIKRPTHNNTTWDMAKFEVVAHKWADLSEPTYGVAILNDCKYGHSIKQNVIGISLLRSPKIPDPNADMQVHQFTYSLFPHIGNLEHSNVVHEAYSINYPLHFIEIKNNIRPTLPKQKSLINIDKSNIILECIKKCDTTDYIICRFYECYGTYTECTITFNFSIKNAYICNILETNLKTLKINNHNNIFIPFNAFEVITIKIQTD